MFINLFDSHIHSDNSFDGRHSITLLCEMAVRKELSGVVITDHCDINCYDVQQCERRMKQSFFEGLIAKDIFKRQLSVSLGMEIGQPFEDIQTAEKAVSMQDYDFILMSLHNLKGQDDFYYMDYTDIDIDALMDAYFKELLDIVNWGQFDVLAHLTYPLRHITGEHGIAFDSKKHRQIIDALLLALAQKGKGLELNLSGLRRQSKLLLPTIDYLKRFRELGGEVVTIGSDSHTSNTVGDYISDGMELLAEAGYNYFSFYKERKPTMLRII